MTVCKELKLEAEAAEIATAEMYAALDALPVAVRASQLRKFHAVFDKQPGRLFITKVKLSGAGPTYHMERAVMEPTQFYLDAIAAVRAGVLDWDIELPAD